MIDQVNSRNDPNQFGFAADVTCSEQMCALLDRVQERFGGVDVMVNNAGVGNPCGFTTMPDEQWDKVVNVNLKAVISCCNLAIPYLTGRGGCILNTSFPGRTHYLHRAQYLRRDQSGREHVHQTAGPGIVRPGHPGQRCGTRA